MEPSAKWADIAAQAIFHTLVASLFVEALVRSWRVREPRQRMALRLVALGYPLVAFPALVLAFPLRADEAFHDGPALLVARRWGEVHLLGAGLFEWWLDVLGSENWIRLQLLNATANIVLFVIWSARLWSRPASRAGSGPG